MYSRRDADEILVERQNVELENLPFLFSTKSPFIGK